MLYPIRNSVDGVLYIQKRHFHIHNRKHAVALIQFLQGHSYNEIIKHITNEMREMTNYAQLEKRRRRLYEHLREFKGDRYRENLHKFCLRHDLHPNENNSIRVQNIFSRYLLEEFDLRPPLAILDGAHWVTFPAPKQYPAPVRPPSLKNTIHP